MTNPTPGPAAPASIYVRVTWGAYERNFTVDSDVPQLKCHDEHRTIVQVAAFDADKYPTQLPVQLTCTAMGHFMLSALVDEAFQRLAVGKMPEGSISEDELMDELRLQGKSSYSLPTDLYPHEVQVFMSDTFVALYECASRAWRLLRWRLSALGSHALFETILAGEWSRDGDGPWYPFPIKLMLGGSVHAVPRLDVSAADSVQELLATGTVEPTSQELLREAWSLQHGNPRAALLLAVSAAEVGIKELLIDLVPQVAWLALHVPSPPLVGLLKNALPQLPVRQGVASAAPPEIRTVMRKAVDARNDLAHQGQFESPNVNLGEVIDAVQSLLQQFEYYRGFAWVAPTW